MNRITPVVLLALLVLLGSYVIVFEMMPSTRLSTGIEGELLKNRVFPVSVDDGAVKQLRIARDDEVVAFERTAAGVWRMRKPYPANVRQDLVQDLVRGLIQLERSTADIPKADWPPEGLAAYGLNRPKLTVTLTFDTGEHSLEFGSSAPSQPWVYTRRPDVEAVTVIPDLALRMLQMPVEAFRQKRFLAFDRRKLARLQLRSPKAKIELVRSEGRWRVTKPYNDGADVLNLDKLFKAIDAIEARSFAAEGPPSLKPYGLDVPRVQFTYTLSDNQTQFTQSVLIGGPAKEPVGTVYAKLADAPNVYTVPDGIVGALTFDSVWLRDRKLFWLGRFDVKRMLVERPGKSLVFNRDMKRNIWVMSEPEKHIAEESEVNRFIAKLGTLEVVRFPNDAPDEAALKHYGLDAASRITVTIKRWDKPDIVLTAGNVDPKHKDLYVRRGTSGPVYTVPGSFGPTLTAPTLRFRDRTMTDLGAGNLLKLSIRGTHPPVTVVREKGDKWRMTKPASAPANDIAVDRLVDRLEKLKASALLAEKPADLAPYGLDRPAWELEFDYGAGTGQTQTGTLLIGKQMGPEGFPAMLKGRDLVFALWPGMVDYLNAEFRRQIVWQLPRRGLREFVWTAGTDTVRLRHVGARWQLIEPQGAVADLQQVESVIAALLNLRVERFTDYTKKDLAKYKLDKPRVTLTLKFDDRERILHIGGDAPEKGSAYATVADQDPVFALPPSLVRWLLRKPLAGEEPVGN